MINEEMFNTFTALANSFERMAANSRSLWNATRDDVEGASYQLLETVYDNIAKAIHDTLKKRR